MKDIKTLSLVGVGAILFHFVFWNQDLGINLVLYMSFILGSNLILKQGKINTGAKMTLIGSILSLLLFFVHHSLVSLVASLVSPILFIGFVHYDKTRSVWYSLMGALINLFNIRKLEVETNLEINKSNRFKWERNAKLTIIPLVVLFIFVLIFRFANPIFDGYITEIENTFSDFIFNFFDYFSINRILFFSLGLILTAALIVKGKWLYFENKESHKQTTITRVRNRVIVNLKNHQENGVYKAKKEYPEIPTLALKNERISATITLGLIAVLLFIVNSIDIVYVWFAKTISTTKTLTEMVHEGTYLLIFSILLSIFIMLYIFRRNQNFYKGNGLLKKLAYTWIIQNIVLVISVAIRNHNYISNYGLTHKRIGVYVFLLLTIIGLYTLYLKIKDKKSLFYLVLTNGKVFYTTLVLLAFVNWDSVIVSYNINNLPAHQIDYKYLVTLSNNSLITLDLNKDKLNQDLWNSDIYLNWKTTTPAQHFQQRIDYIHYKTQEPLSWNYADFRIKNYFKKQNHENQNN